MCGYIHSYTKTRVIFKAVDHDLQTWLLCTKYFWWKTSFIIVYLVSHTITRQYQLEHPGHSAITNDKIQHGECSVSSFQKSIFAYTNNSFYGVCLSSSILRLQLSIGLNESIAFAKNKTSLVTLDLGLRWWMLDESITKYVIGHVERKLRRRYKLMQIERRTNLLLYTTQLKKLSRLVRSFPHLCGLKHTFLYMVEWQ